MSCNVPAAHFFRYVISNLLFEILFSTRAKSTRLADMPMAATSPRLNTQGLSIVVRNFCRGSSSSDTSFRLHGRAVVAGGSRGTARANIPKSRGRGCFLYASRTEKKTGSYVAICAQEYRPHMSTTPGSVRFGQVTSILKHSFLDTSFNWVRVALYPLPQHDSPFWHSEDTSVETCLVESQYMSHPLTCARACDERRIYFLNSKLLVI